MQRRSRYTQNPEHLNIFQSFTDLMSNAFMILCLFLLLALIQSQQLNKRLQSASPIVIDEKSGKFKFKSGSAELKPELKTYILTEILPTIETTIKEREIDFIQVIGHTDGQKNNRASNLDSTLESVAKGSQSVSKLNPGSNADLGLMRALAVVQELEKTGNFKNIKFRAYSAAQLYLPSGKLAPLDRNADENRRRIEIRFIPPGRSK
jgi:outer membrane protein OmpA-like peptidoglycan-associated protein